MGLKQDAANALATPPIQPKAVQPKTLRPVQISGDATRAMSQKAREWSGWADARLVFGKPPYSPFAACEPDTHTFIANVDALLLNPHRVLNTVTPFRLRQEAVLTGALLHEAGHARHSHWLPNNEEQARTNPALHSDGTVPTRQAIALAVLMEEPRVEGLIARDADEIGAAGLGWTMRAAAAKLLPTTHLTISDPGQQVMDLIESWAKRAGRQLAIQRHSPAYYSVPDWVGDFTALLHVTLSTHLSNTVAIQPGTNLGYDPSVEARTIIDLLRSMISCDDDSGPTMLDHARAVLAALFPETDGDDEDAPMPDSGCGAGQGTAASPSEEDEEGGDESDGGEVQSEDAEPGDGSADSESGTSEEDDEPEDGEGEAETEETLEDAELSETLAELEQAFKSETAEEVKVETSKAPSSGGSGGTGASAGGSGGLGGGFRDPTKDEREMQKGAEKFLRDLISPTESSKVTLTESPSATVDGAALAAWKASGQVREPEFFRRTRREVEPSPPVMVATLVDVSGSMDQLQKPSAQLSWALASAALDLRNFAGRGQQIQSTLIHWGDYARVIQKPGEMMPGIREVSCREGTDALHMALALVEEQMPGFFDVSEKPVHRLLVQFTDWGLESHTRRLSTPIISKAMEAGVNMVSVVPGNWTARYSDLTSIMAGCHIQRGTSTVLKYDRYHPERVWEAAAEALT